LCQGYMEACVKVTWKLVSRLHGSLKPFHPYRPVWYVPNQ